MQYYNISKHLYFYTQQLLIFKKNITVIGKTLSITNLRFKNNSCFGNIIDGISMINYCKLRLRI